MTSIVDLCAYVQGTSGRFFAVISIEGVGELEPLVDLLFGGTAHEIVEKAADLPHIAR